jgi:tRNA A-37 threonylcarbamoyl transferase component Bud32
VAPIPFVVGQWVRGRRFYGRAALIEEILEGPRSSVWLLGTRRVGKTSLLKQIEHLAHTAPKRRFFPLFWDFQGAEEPGELHLNFADALLDAEERLEAIGVGLAEIEADDLFVSLGQLRRQLRSEKLGLLLLCDEVEELINLSRKDPSLLRKLRRVMQGHEDVRSVLASTIRLWALAGEKGDTSPFLHGFTPPLYIERLTDEEARSLIQQSHLPPEDRPVLPEGAVEAIRQKCDNHPYLIQLVGKRCLETGDLSEAIEQVATDRMVSHFFSVDFEMLSEGEQATLRTLARESPADPEPIRRDRPAGPESPEAILHRLERLGFVRRDDEGRFLLANDFHRQWLQEMPFPVRGGGSSEATWTREPAHGVIDDRYELLKVAGEGATGIVYEASDRQLRTKIAIKVLRQEYAATEAAVERFRQEIVLARDIGHPNILRMYHFGTFEGRIYLTMQWVDGPTLADVIRRDAPLPLETTLSLGRKLASALEAAHSRQTLHRDIKPQNVLIDGAGEPLITDFGLARLKGEPGLTRDGMFLGTPDYASPEQCHLRPVDERSDLYALGVVLFEMATGRKPFEADSASQALEMHRRAPPPDPRELEPDIPPALSRLILRCLQKDPAARFPSAAALREALESLEGR